MSTASQKTNAKEIKEVVSWQDQQTRNTALSHAVCLVRTGTYDPKNIVKDAQIFYDFLKRKQPK